MSSLWCDRGEGKIRGCNSYQKLTSKKKTRRKQLQLLNMLQQVYLIYLFKQVVDVYYLHKRIVPNLPSHLLPLMSTTWALDGWSRITFIWWLHCHNNHISSKYSKQDRLHAKGVETAFRCRSSVPLGLPFKSLGTAAVSSQHPVATSLLFFKFLSSSTEPFSGCIIYLVVQQVLSWHNHHISSRLSKGPHSDL